MAQFPIRQEMRMVSVFIMRMKMMESMLSMLLLLAIVLAIRIRSSKFRRSIKYVDGSLSRHNIRSINLNEMVFHNDRQYVDNCRMDMRALAKLCYMLTTHGKLKGIGTCQPANL